MCQKSPRLPKLFSLYFPGVCKTFHFLLPSSPLFMLLLLPGTQFLLLPWLIPTHPSIFSSDLTFLPGPSLYLGRVGYPYSLFSQNPAWTIGRLLHVYLLSYHLVLIYELFEEHDHVLHMFLSLVSTHRRNLSNAH